MSSGALHHLQPSVRFEARARRLSVRAWEERRTWAGVTSGSAAVLGLCWLDAPPVTVSSPSASAVAMCKRGASGEIAGIRSEDSEDLEELGGTITSLAQTPGGHEELASTLV